MLKNIVLSFIPIFVAVDAVGVLPIYISLTYSLNKGERIKIIFGSVITATLLTIGFIFIGKFIFNLMGITVNDFMIAGGAILFCISIIGIIDPDKKAGSVTSGFAVVPLGTPLIAGPAVLTTCLIVLEQYGLVPTLISVIISLIFTGIILYLSDFIIKIIGGAGTKALSKITSLFLAAIAVMMIRKGIISIIEMFK
jgi:multiple antibiotic resistance protein